MSISKTKLNVLVNKNVKIAFWREKVRQKLHQRNFNPVKGSSERRKKLEHWFKVSFQSFRFLLQSTNETFDGSLKKLVY